MKLLGSVTIVLGLLLTGCAVTPVHTDPPATPEAPDTRTPDDTWVGAGWTVAERGNLYVKFAEKGSYTCSVGSCWHVQVHVVNGCPTNLYVEGSLTATGTVVGITNDLLGVIQPNSDAVAELPKLQANADHVQITKLNCS